MPQALRNLFALCLLLISAPLLAAGFTEGVDYQRITPPQAGAEPGKVQVTELFWYGCPHCYQFDPYVEKWLKNKPEHVEFSHMPAIFTNNIWQLHAAAYYTAEVLGVVEKIHTPFFEAMHRDKRRMDSMDDLAQLFADHAGISTEQFNKTMASFAVQSKARRAADMTRRYKITGVPNIVVNGKYRVDGPMAKTYDNLLRIVDFLIEKELQQQVSN